MTARAVALAAALLAAGCTNMPTDLDALWDYDRPAESEARFRALLASQPPPRGDARSEAETQLARALGLQRRFGEAHAVLDGVEARLAGDPGDSPRRALVRARLHLERGRVLRSSGQEDAARPEFARALAVAEAARLERFAADALHMLALVAPPEERVAAHRAAIARIESSRDPSVRRWLAPLTNNLAWALHDGGEYDAALTEFERAVPLFAARGEPRALRIARWSVARAQRSLGRCAEALPAQRALLDEWRAAGEEDGFVHEEIAECLLALGRGGDARAHFREAHRLLAQDERLRREEPARLARLARLAEP